MKPSVCLCTPIVDRPHAWYNESLHKVLLSGAISEYFKVVGNAVHISKNGLVQLALERNHTHIWMIDAETFGFDAEMLKGLLAHDVDVVAPLTFMRNPPYEPMICYFDESGRPISIIDYARKSFFEVGAVGMGCCLIRTSVFQKINWPWFQHGLTMDKKWVSEDIMFCSALRKVGIKIYADTNYCADRFIEWPIDEDMWDLLQSQKEEQTGRIRDEWRDLLA